jgi:hypothetical protein
MVRENGAMMPVHEDHSEAFSRLLERLREASTNYDVRARAGVIEALFAVIDFLSTFKEIEKEHLDDQPPRSGPIS